MINILNLVFYINQISNNRGISIFILLIGLALTLVFVYKFSSNNSKFIIQIVQKYKSLAETEMNQIIPDQLRKQTIGMFVMTAVLFGMFGTMWIIMMLTNTGPEELIVSFSIVITFICAGLSIMMTVMFSSGDGYSETVLEAKLAYFRENKKYKKIPEIVALLVNRYIPKMEIEKATECWKDEKEAYIQLNRKDKVIKTDVMIAAAYFEIKKKDLAFDFLNDAKRIATEIGDLQNIAECEKLEREQKL
jgi:hypothetical protein